MLSMGLLDSLVGEWTTPTDKGADSPWNQSDKLKDLLSMSLSSVFSPPNPGKKDHLSFDGDVGAGVAEGE